MGAEHPDVAYSLHNLALLYKYLGKYEEVLPIFFLKSLEIMLNHYGVEHPDWVSVMINLSAIYCDQGLCEEVAFKNI